MSDRYYYRKHHNKITGPFPAARLMAMRREDVLSRDDLISTDKVNWMPVTDFEWLYKAEEIKLEAVVDPAQPLKKKQPPDRLPLPYPVPQPGRGHDTLEIAPLEQPVEHMPAGRIIGDTIMLAWNSTDKLLPLRRENETRRTVIAFATAFLLSLILSLLGGMACSRLYDITLLRGLLTGLAAPPVIGMLIFVEIWLFEVVLLPDSFSRNCLNEVMLAAVILFIFTMGNISSCATLHFIVMPPHPVVKLLAVIFNLLVWSFIIANATTALRIGLTYLVSGRPRNAVWLAGLVVGSNLTLIYLIVYVFIISKGLS